MDEYSHIDARKKEAWASTNKKRSKKALESIENDLMFADPSAPYEPDYLARAAFLVLVLSVLLIAGCFIGSRPAHAASIVEIAQSQIGKGEIGGDNRGPQVKKYTRGQEVAWCAAFVSWVRSQSGQASPYLLAARSYWKNYSHKRVARPRSGDLIIFARGNHQGHIGIVERVQGNTITTIEGNVGKFPATVRRFTYQIGNIKNLLGFVRV